MKAARTLRNLTAVCTALLCAALCWTAVALYRDGLAARAAAGSAAAPIFDREAVAAALGRLLPLAGCWLACAVAAAVCGRNGADIPQAAPDGRQLLRLLRARAARIPEEAVREAKRRRAAGAICAAVTAACAAWGAAVLLQRSRFTDTALEAAMAGLLASLAPPLALGFAAMFTWEWLARRSIEKETALLRSAPRAEVPGRAPLRGRRETKGAAAARAVLLAAAAALLWLGVRNGGLNDVLVKAINICTECIGLG